MKTLVVVGDQNKKKLKVIKKMHRRINSLVEEINILITQNYELTTELNTMGTKNLQLSQDIN